jgi:hypothetical protein
MMKPIAAILALLLVPAPGRAQDHVVSPAEVQARLAAAASDRAEAVRAVDAALGKGVSRLSAAELRDLDVRAQRLTTDPVAGTHPVIWVLAGLGAIFVLGLVLLVIDCGQGNCD